MPVATPAPPVTLEEEASGVASDAGDNGSSPGPHDVSGAADGPAQEDDWVFEVEPEVDTSVPDMERLDTVEEGLRNAREESSWLSEPSSPTGAPPEEQLDIVEEEIEEEEESPWFTEPSSPSGESPPTEAPAPEPVIEVPPPPAPPQPAAPAAGFTFGRRDPHEKASRLARVLVSDMIAYNKERHQQALDGGTLREDFEDEIEKSVAEYVEQVGRELADSTDYFEKALNEILARGQQIF